MGVDGGDGVSAEKEDSLWHRYSSHSLALAVPGAAAAPDHQPLVVVLLLALELQRQAAVQLAVVDVARPGAAATLVLAAVAAPRW
jgi:hypothetical protein